MFAMGNWGPELVEIANGELLIGRKGEYSNAIPAEQLRAADPEYLDRRAVRIQPGAGCYKSRPSSNGFPGGRSFKPCATGTSPLPMAISSLTGLE